MPSSRQATMMRIAISPRFAIRIFLNIYLVVMGPHPHDLYLAASRRLGDGGDNFLLSRLIPQGTFMANSRSPYWTGWPFST